MEHFSSIELEHFVGPLSHPFCHTLLDSTDPAPVFAFRGAPHSFRHSSITEVLFPIRLPNNGTLPVVLDEPSRADDVGPAQHHHHAAAAAAACNMSFATEYFVDVFTASFSNGHNSVVESIRIRFYYWFVARLNFSTPKHREPVTNT